MSWRQLLREAESNLADTRRGTDWRERLQVSARAFWRATLYLERWPLPCQDEAKALTATFLAKGLIRETIEALEEAEIPTVSARLLAFCRRMTTLPFQSDEETSRYVRILGQRELQSTQ